MVAYQQNSYSVIRSLILMISMLLYDKEKFVVDRDWRRKGLHL